MISKKQPPICYEDEETSPFSKIPFIKTDEENKMPNILFLFEMQENGFEKQDDGGLLPVVDAELHQYFSASEAKKLLDAGTYDKIRVAFGLEPLQSAINKGRGITEKVKNNVKKTEEERKKENKDNKPN